MNFFNPFLEFYASESNRHIHAATLRGGFLKKIQDTFKVLAGNPFRHFYSLFKYDNFYIPYTGLLDYATFLIPWVTGRIFRWCMETFDKESSPSVLRVIMTVILIVPSFVLAMVDLLVMRLLLPAILTILASVTIIPVVQFISWVASYPLKQKINQLSVQVIDESSETNRYEVMSSRKILGDLLSEKAADLDSIGIFYQHAPTEDEFEDATVKLTEQGYLSFGYDDDEFSTKFFTLSKEQYETLARAKDIKQELIANPEKYISPQLILTKIIETSSTGYSCEPIACIPTDAQSLKVNHEAIQAMLELNVGRLSHQFDNEANETFKAEFPDETSLPRMSM